MDELVKEHETLFVGGPYSQLLQHANQKARQQPEQVERRREKQLRKQEEKRREQEEKRKQQEEREKERLQALREEQEEEQAICKAQEEEDIRQREIEARRTLQHRCAGHPGVKNLWLSTINYKDFGARTLSMERPRSIIHPPFRIFEED